MYSSPGVRPARASTSRNTRSASSMAKRDCPAMARSMPSSPPWMPPLSWTMNLLSSKRRSPYWRSRVRPGMSATSASRLLVRRLNNVDLPTLGRPTRAITGTMSRDLWKVVGGSADPQGNQRTAVAVSVECVALRDHRCAQPVTIHLGTAYDASVDLRQEVHVAFEVAHGQVVAEAHWRGQAAAQQGFVGPYRLVLANAEGTHVAALVREVGIAEA